MSSLVTQPSRIDTPVPDPGAAPDRRGANLAVLVAALGYFVDIYDLLLFSILRVKSLGDLGVTGADELLRVGARLINMQMTGLLIGGILWGVLADKLGRRSVLFGSIVLYSLANIVNAMVQTVDQYAWLRLIAGIGLAGELGAGITLVAEAMSRHGRGYGTTIVASLGLLGAVVAGFVGQLFHWRTAFVVGGVMGLTLLALRIGVRESAMFTATRNATVSRGNFFALFSNRSRVLRYLSVILLGLPLWYVMGILVTFSPEVGRSIGLPAPPNPAHAVGFAYFGATVGDLMSGFLSQALRSRKRALILWLTLCALGVAQYFILGRLSLTAFNLACFVLGAASGYWAVLMTVASEQFGTNLRATATSTVPNFIRGAVVPLTTVFQALKPGLGVQGSAIAVGAGTLLIAYLALTGIEETYAKNLDYLEA